MDQKTFNSFANSLLSQAAKIRNAKMEEYEATVDRLANFRKASCMTGEKIPKIIAGMMVKHTVSIYDMVEGEFNQFNTDPPYPLELWREKLIDQINYLLLLYGAIREDRS